MLDVCFRLFLVFALCSVLLYTTNALPLPLLPCTPVLAVRFSVFIYSCIGWLMSCPYETGRPKYSVFRCPVFPCVSECACSRCACLLRASLRVCVLCTVMFVHVRALAPAVVIQRARALVLGLLLGFSRVFLTFFAYVACPCGRP